MTNRRDSPLDATPEADALEQQSALVEEAEDPGSRELTGAEADEADLSEQATAVPATDEDEYDR